MLLRSLRTNFQCERREAVGQKQNNSIQTRVQVCTGTSLRQTEAQHTTKLNYSMSSIEQMD